MYATSENSQIQYLSFIIQTTQNTYMHGGNIPLWKYKYKDRIAGVDVTAGPWPVYLRSGQSNWAKIGLLGQLIFSGHLGQQLSFLLCHSISTDNRLMKFPDKTLKFNFNHSPKAINSLITQSACVYLDLLPHVKRIWREIYAGNQYFIIQ
jgi:hypothetical protein